MSSTSPSNSGPGRECGECTACCRHLSIETEEIRKIPGIFCVHCADKKGCTIYETRPKVCRDYLCGWRLSGLFDDSWRPDRSGVLVTVVNRNIPENYMQEGLELLLVQPQTALARPDFHQFIFRAVAIRVPVFVYLPGPAGFLAAGNLLNPVLEDAVQKQDEERFFGIVEAAVREIGQGPFAPAVLKQGIPADRSV